MKKRRKSKKSKNILINTSPKSKMSEFIAEYASDYINMGSNTEERQSYLNGACTAWNIAVLPEHLRKEALKKNLEDYKRLNPEIDDSDDLMHDMKILIQKKIKMFPNEKKVILNAFVEPINDTQYRIRVVSTDKPEQVKQMITSLPT